MLRANIVIQAWIYDKWWSTDFQNNKRQRDKVLEGSAAMLPQEKSHFLGFKVILKNLTNFRKTVETGVDQRLPFIYLP